MKRSLVSFALLCLMGCGTRQPAAAKQGPTGWQPPSGSTWVHRAMPAWPPTAEGDYRPIDPGELQTLLPAVGNGQLAAPPHRAGGNPFIAEASFCVNDGDAAALTAETARTLESDGWATTELGGQLHKSIVTTTQVSRAGYVLTLYAANVRAPGCTDPERQTYLTFVAGKRN